MSPSPLALTDEFLAQAEPGPFAYDACHHISGTSENAPTLVFGFAIHGNEHGSLPALLRLQRELTRAPARSHITLLLGNVDAVRADERFLEEDFNRVFTFDRPASSLERKRAELVRPILDRADFFLDFHQTQTPTSQAFYTFPWSDELVAWARVLQMAKVGLTRPAGQAFSSGLRCLDEYVRDRGKVALTIETGMRGQDELQAELVYQGARRAILAWDAITEKETSLAALAARAPEIAWYHTQHIIRSDGQSLRLKPGLENWTELEAGELLSAPGSVVVRSPSSGYALFPKYVKDGETPPPELLRIASPFEPGPL